MSEKRVKSFRAQFLLVSPGRCFAPGELRVAGGRVLGAGPVRGGRVPARAILPGLVNAHVHLQIPPLSRVRRQFLPWVRAVMAQRGKRVDTEDLRRAAATIRELLRDGVTALGEVDSTGLSPRVLREVPVGGVCYQELTGFDLGPTASRGLVRRRETPGSRHCRGGLSPHAPYSVSRALFRAARARRVPLAVHAAETPEEIQFLHDGRGPFADLLERLGRLPEGYRPPGVGAVALLHRLGILDDRTTLIHCQHLTADEVDLVRARRTPIVVCPGTIDYFRRQPPPVPDWLDAGVTVALGTDSIASNTHMSIRHEMALARRMWPSLAPETVLAMATAHGGEALDSASLGTLRRGAPASFLTVPIERDASACLESFTHGALGPREVFLRGERVA
jgi:aminodeoxyfutalosine deaminase